ncbi:MAG: methyltransferase [Gammaproteobacteria bacterium]|jgi:predicted methyltransferase
MIGNERRFVLRVLIAVLGAGSIVADAAQAQSARYSVPDGTPANIARAIESSGRTLQERDRDSLRRPAEILTLVGIEEGDRVIEFASFGNYYTKLLAAAVGPAGHVYMIDMPWTEPFGGNGSRSFAAEHENASYTLAHYNRVELPADVDVAMMVLFYHDLKVQTGAQSVDPMDMNARIFAALRPGGRFLVVDHKAEDFAAWSDVASLHRIDEATIIQEVTAAGFELVADSNILANPDDDHQLNMRDPAIRGKTDRAVLVFRKPAR